MEHSPGTSVETFVTFLTAAQLKRMHETEGAYFLNELTRLDLHVGLSLEAFRWDTALLVPLMCGLLLPSDNIVQLEGMHEKEGACNLACADAPGPACQAVFQLMGKPASNLLGSVDFRDITMHSDFWPPAL